VHEDDEDVSMGIAMSHSMTCHFISNKTFDLIITRSHTNGDTKGLWKYQLNDEDYARLDMAIVIASKARTGVNSGNFNREYSLAK
jgi:hypothetical protein